MTKVRESNIELLRIIAIIMISVHHYLLDVRYHCILDGNLLQEGWQWAFLVNGFAFIGVNLFVLISGFYGIKFKWKGLINLFIFCAFYMFISLVTKTYILGIGNMSMKGILIRTIEVFSNTPKWFIRCYITLYVISPFLNVAVNYLEKKQYLYSLFILSVYLLWFGFVRQSPDFKNNGYSVSNFIWLYFIGGYIRRFVNINNLKKHQMKSLSIWAVCSILWGTCSILLTLGYSIPFWRPITYNNPFTMIGSIAFFCTFLTLNIQSNFINHIAKSALAVYLFDLPLSYFPILFERANVWNHGEYFIWATIWILGCFVLTIAIDQVRLVFMIPVNKLWQTIDNRTKK